MPIARTFLEWSRPALPATVDYLLQQYRRDNTIDLDHVVLVLPGGRAGRRLTEILLQQAEEHSLLLLPPEHCTVGNLPELLYEPRLPFANDLTQRLAWVQALKQTGPDRCRKLITQLPPDEDYAGWMDLGGLLQRQHRELAADTLDFAHVADQGTRLAGFQEKDRWELLARIQKRYLRLLDDLKLWDLQTARLYAIEHKECRTDQDIVLVGTTDMSIAMRRMLDQVADRVTALIHAPESLADRFDQHGCLLPDAWLETEIGLETEQIRLVDAPADQADAVVDCIASFAGRYRSDQIVVGILDEQLVPQILRRLEQARLPGRWVVGKTLSETAPYRLLEALGRYVERRRFTEFAALLRHPDVGIWLVTNKIKGDCLSALDNYYSQHLQPRVGPWLGNDRDCKLLSEIHTALEREIAALGSDPRPLTEWAVPITRLLSAFYGDRKFNLEEPRHYYTVKALEQLRSALLEQQEIPSDIAPSVPVSEAIRQLLDQCRGSQVPSPVAAQQIELLGWLELPLDTAPALIATSFNEGNVPTSVNSDLFLPNALRQQLDLVDNRRRYARDAYALSVLQASRDDLSLIAGRRTSDNDPLIPSRLLFATDAETMAERAIAFFRPPEQEGLVPPVIATSAAGSQESEFVVRRPPPLAQPITSISVTSFRDYIACPYRFYLTHVLGLKTTQDAAAELGPAEFGTLIHEVLSRFGTAKLRASTDADKIRRFLNHTLNQCVNDCYGTQRLPAVEVQLVQARARLSAFADWQARRASDGWEIIHTETQGGEEPASLQLGDNRSIELRGRIDRIDHRKGQWAVLDYKTSDTAKTPKDTHLKSGNWVDLQLPLYTHLADSLEINGPIQLGYILLPKEINKVGAEMADWDAAMLESADQTAIEIANNIVDETFWPPQNPPSNRATDFAAICQEHAFRPQLEGSSTEGNL